MLAAIALGSNLQSSWGAPDDALAEAVRRLGELGHVVAVSSMRTTEPVGYSDQPRFRNGAALLDTTLAPLRLMEALLAIELAMGRVREGAIRNGPRVIDLDLLLYGATVLSTPNLTLPHPLMHDRAFVLEPLAEIAPTMLHPVLHVTIGALLARLNERPPDPGHLALQLRD